MIMEADKTQNLLSELANWRLKKANGIVLVIRPAGFSSSSKAGKKKQCSNLKAVRKNSLLPGEVSDILFYSGLQLTRWISPTLRRTIYFIQPTHLNVNLISKHSHRYTENNVGPILIWHIKLTITLSIYLSTMLENVQCCEKQTRKCRLEIVGLLFVTVLNTVDKEFLTGKVRFEHRS